MDLKSFTQAIRELTEEKSIAEAKVIETIELAVAAAYKKDYGKRGQIIRARFSPETGELRFSQIKIVVDESMIKSEEEIQAEEAARETLRGEVESGEARPPEQREKESEEVLEELAPAGEAAEVKRVRFNPERHLMLAEAQKIKQDVQPGEELEFPLEPKTEFGRIASQTAKQVIIQRIREAEREATYSEYKTKEGEIVSGIVQRIEGRSVFVDLGRGVGVLPPEEQLARERYAIGERLKSLLILVEKDPRGPGMILSRSHPRFLKKLFELEVPEIAAGSVEIKSIAREPGSRSKVAAVSHDAAIDPVGSMVGQRGVRVSTVMNEIGGEKIDIIEWSDDQAHFVANALSPAKILDVELAPERREATVIAPDDQLSLAIGKGGQNVRLAAKLTGWKIDVRSNAPQPRVEAATGAGEGTEAAETATAEATGAPDETGVPTEVSAPAPETLTKNEENAAAEAVKPMEETASPAPEPETAKPKAKKKTTKKTKQPEE